MREQRRWMKTRKGNNIAVVILPLTASVMLQRNCSEMQCNIWMWLQCSLCATRLLRIASFQQIRTMPKSERILYSGTTFRSDRLVLQRWGLRVKHSITSSIRLCVRRGLKGARKTYFRWLAFFFSGLSGASVLRERLWARSPWLTPALGKRGAKSSHYRLSLN